MTDIAETLATGFQHHQAGRLAEAEQLYLDVLKEMPEHADALHLLGLIARRKGDNEKAVSLIGKVVAINPAFAEAHANLANALFDLNRHDEAIAAYETAVSLNPAFATARAQLVTLLTARGHAAAAAGRPTRHAPHTNGYWNSNPMRPTSGARWPPSRISRICMRHTAALRGLAARPGQQGGLWPFLERPAVSWRQGPIPI